MKIKDGAEFYLSLFIRVRPEEVGFLSRFLLHSRELSDRCVYWTFIVIRNKSRPISELSSGAGVGLWGWCMGGVVGDCDQ